MVQGNVGALEAVARPTEQEVILLWFAGSVLSGVFRRGGHLQASVGHTAAEFKSELFKQVG